MLSKIYTWRVIDSLWNNSNWNKNKTDFFYIPQNNEVERNQRSGNEHQKIQNWMIAAGLRWGSTKPFKFCWSEIVSHLNLVPLSFVERKLEKFPDLDYEVLKKMQIYSENSTNDDISKFLFPGMAINSSNQCFFFSKSMIVREFRVQKTVYFSNEMYLL